MENKVIEVLDYLGEKFGIAIDWTAENVWPQVTEFMGRYTMYEIIRAAVWVVIGLIVISVAATFLVKAATGLCNSGSFWWHHDDAAIITLIISTIASGVFIVVVLFNIFEIIGWATVPEMKFIETISHLIQAHS